MRVLSAFAGLAVVSILSAPIVAQEETVYTPGDGVTLPTLVKSVKAQYTKEAIDQRIEGTVTLDTVVRSDGTVGEVKVAQSLDSVFGLDNEAIKAVKQYEFKPGTRDTRPVAVRVQIAVSFRLQ